MCLCVCLYLCVCVREGECVCVCVREREREREREAKKKKGVLLSSHIVMKTVRCHTKANVWSLICFRNAVLTQLKFFSHSLYIGINQWTVTGSKTTVEVNL